MNLKVKELLKLVIVGLLLVGVTSCERSDSTCTTEVYRIPVNQKSESKSASVVIDGNLSGNVYVDGNVIINGDLITNGYDVQVLGNLDIQGTFYGHAESLVQVQEVLTVHEYTRVSGATIVAKRVLVDDIFGDTGNVYYCDFIIVGGENYTNYGVIQQDCGNVLSTNSVQYSTTRVTCDMVGQTVNGYVYVEVPKSNTSGKMLGLRDCCDTYDGEAHAESCSQWDDDTQDEGKVAIRTCCESTAGAAHTSSCIDDDAPDSGQE